MEALGTVVIYVIMMFVILGALAAVRDDKSGMGKEFLEGLHSIGPIFIPVAGIMASIPYLSRFITAVFGPGFEAVGADPAIAATTFIAVDMGGYQLAEAVAATREAWVIATVVGYMAGATIVFSIPVGLAMLQKRDHKYMALGIMSGILTVPVGVLIAGAVIALSNTRVREVISADAPADLALTLGFDDLIVNLVPLLIFCALIAAGLRFLPDLMIRGFMGFGRIMDIGIKLVLALSIVEYFTGAFTTLFGAWGFDGIIADEADQFRALEIAGYIGIMLAGAFPMVYAIRTWLATPLTAVGRRLGLSVSGSAGFLASIANILAMFHLVKTMPPKDKVLNISFAVCAAFLFGDHLAFTANFQPTLIGPITIGKLSGGLLAVALAYWIALPKARELESRDREAGVIGDGEYLEVPVGGLEREAAIDAFEEDEIGPV